MVLTFLCFASGSAASSFFYDGFVTGGSGAGSILTPPGDSVFLLFHVDTLESGDIVNGSDITSLELYVGGFCFSAGVCSLGTAGQVPIIDVETEMMVYTPFANNPFEGELNFLVFLQLFKSRRK